MKKLFSIKYLSVFILVLGVISTSRAQSILGLHSDNYAGVYSLGYNPAEIVDSRYWLHVNIASFNGTFSSNYLGLKREAFFGSDSPGIFSPEALIKDISKRINYLKVQREGVKDRLVYNESEISLFPSFMINFGRDNQHAIGFTYKLRYQSAFTGSIADIAIMSLSNPSILSIDNSSISGDKETLQFNLWNEFGLTYGRTLLNTKTNFISAAATLKVTQGYAGAYLGIEKDAIKYDDKGDGKVGLESDISINDQVEFYHSKMLSRRGSGLAGFDLSNLFHGNVGFGLDLGFVWEYRPNVQKYLYPLDGFDDTLDPTKEKYKLKVGVSIIDLGYVSYDSFSGDNAGYNISINGVRFGDIIEPISDGLVNNLRFSGIADALTSASGTKESKDDTFNVMLPTKLNVYVDYRINENFYANASASIAPNLLGECCQMRGLTQFAITPRYEKKYISVFLPVSANMNGNGSIGAGLRVGPLTLGTTDILPVFGKKQIYEANVYAGLSIPLYKSVKDKDGDHVSNFYDACKEKKGPWENQGCPYDADDDGIPDEDDMCPKSPGTEENTGCPDTDSDGIHDGIDRCIEAIGKVENAGCPDTDEDGIVDIDDMCPEKPGEERYSGCSDIDKDGIHDGIDDCPEIAGEERYDGCIDTDGDTIRDIDDKCVNTFGKKIYDGCPPVPPLIAENYRKFDSNIVELSTQSLEEIEAVVDFLNKNPEYNLHIEGHTDATAAIPYNNVVVGRQRATRLRDYFVKQGIDLRRISVKSYGEKKPADTNTTREGRARNRRVELILESDQWPVR